MDNPKTGKHCTQRQDEDRQRKTQHKKLKRWETQNLQKKEGAVPVTCKKPALLLKLVKSGKGLISDGGMKKITSLHLIWPFSALMF
jgi:hypothetical protein